MINNLYLKKFAGADVKIDSALESEFSDPLSKAMLITSNTTADYPWLAPLLGAGIGGTAGYFIPGKDASKKKKLLSALGGAGLGGALAYGGSEVNNAAVSNKFVRALASAMGDLKLLKKK